MSAVPQAAVLLTGSELLDGRVRDRNGATLTSSLAARGARVAHVLTVPDDARQIVAALRFSLDQRLDLLVVSGGLGTTHDDLTTAAVAEATGRDLVEDAQALAWVEERTRSICRSRGLQFDAAFAQMRRQALLPAGSRPLPPAGAAPGFTLVVGGTTIVVLPGVPAELEPMWASVADELERQGFFASLRTRTVRIFGAGELQVVPVLAASRARPARRGRHGGRRRGDGVHAPCRWGRGRGASAGAGRRSRTSSCPCSRPMAAPSTSSSPTVCVHCARPWPPPSRAPEACSAPGSRRSAGSSDYFVGGVVSYANEVKAESSARAGGDHRCPRCSLGGGRVGHGRAE